MLTMPKVGKYHALGWAIDHVMSAPNVRAKTQREIGEIATRGGYKADDKLVGTYMRNWPDSDTKPERNGRPRSKPPFGFVWALIQGGNLTQEQARTLTEGWLEIHDEDEREDLENFSSVFMSEQVSSEAWADMLDLESRNTETQGEGNVRDSGNGKRT